VPDIPDGPHVVEVTAADTHDLRRRVLRAGSPTAEVRFAGDDAPGAFHLGVRAGSGELLAVGSFLPVSTPVRPGASAVQLRGMAVEPDAAGTGLGAVVFAAAVERVRATGAEVLWANARDTAVGFYERMGMHVEGDGFVPAETGLPHHLVVLDLSNS
jgi:GNAT superfamily N-acetyltransferase